MTPAPTVSAVIPVHNGEAYVAEAIRSVLTQTRPPIECVVIDDGSADATPEVVQTFGGDVRYVAQRQAGVSTARNRGAELARGELVAFLDHDDQWLPTKLERQLEAITSEQVVMVLCAVNVIDRAGNVLRTMRLRPRDRLLRGMLMFDGTETVSCSSTGLVRRQAFLAGGGFDPHLSMSADWDLLFRAELRNQVAYVDVPLVLYRVHETNMSRNVAVMEQDMTYAFGKVFSDALLPAPLRSQEQRAYARLYRMLAGSYWESGDRRAARRMLWLSLRNDPRIAVDSAHAILRRAAGVGRSGGGRRST